MIIVIGRVEVEPEAIGRLQDALLTMMRATWEEPGCISYSLAVEDAARGIVTIVERWEDEAALKRHFTMPHMDAFNAAIAGIVRAMDVKMYDAANERPLAA